MFRYRSHLVRDWSSEMRSVFKTKTAEQPPSLKKTREGIGAAKVNTSSFHQEFSQIPLLEELQPPIQASKKKSKKGTPLDWFDPVAYKQGQDQKFAAEQEQKKEWERKEDSLNIGDTDPIGRTPTCCSGAYMRKSGQYYHVFYETGKKQGNDGGTIYDVYLLSNHSTPPNYTFNTGTVHMHPLDSRTPQWGMTESQYDAIMRAPVASEKLIKSAKQ